jgi:hypothetical protein
MPMLQVRPSSKTSINGLFPTSANLDKLGCCPLSLIIFDAEPVVNVFAARVTPVDSTGVAPTRSDPRGRAAGAQHNKERSKWRVQFSTCAGSKTVPAA